MPVAPLVVYKGFFELEQFPLGEFIFRTKGSAGPRWHVVLKRIDPRYFNWFFNSGTIASKLISFKVLPDS